ncbi:Probable transcriptional regulator, MerR family [Flavobacterium indicum GPTSA100-9 = DSM 17447]|uniref:Probable transcriptional regulator, MerR family n=1 Tax=Flavobacterium indicum (strain DSM 17447 / CIP 109464 / GPTSA100-9) TaxID=1094466 RepID=H8XUB9_FLAIG|nr:MerR family transcriptional regulator [Flavobacterium indicum]CCG52902.1 Probable transcriptional regulator, MerR family [Flavobacterium indicum GPTSA100-9 = DSM 17447]
MNNIKTVFSIKDLENLSGIKAHTIRIWEKRYNLLEPMRTDTNIRLYNVENLQKLLNVVLLTQFGYKISKISKLSIEEIEKSVVKIQNEKTINDHALSALKMAMLHFDQALFMKTYNELIAEKDFSQVFIETFIPLLNEIGILWTANTITPAHEHFIAYLIKQKILVQIEKHLFLNSKENKQTYVLYLPSNEVHDLGLLFLQYILVAKGNHVIYLGRDLPIEDVAELNNHFEKITYISYWTVAPTEDEIPEYLNHFSTKVLTNNESRLLLFGRKTEAIKDLKDEKIKVYENVSSFISELEN